jgi:hypothetical protein
VSVCLGMSGKRRERIANRMKQAPRRSALGDGLACEAPVSPISIPLALGRAASGSAAMHSATALSSDLGRAAWRARSGSSAALVAHGVVFHFSLPPSPRMVHGADDGLPAFVDVHMLNDDALLAAAPKPNKSFHLRRICTKELDGERPAFL